MRTLAFFLAIAIGIAFFAVSAYAFYPFGGKIVQVYYDEGCEELVMIVVGVRGGNFAFTGGTRWYTLPVPPLAGAWTLGIAASQGDCAPILIGGASQV